MLPKQYEKQFLYDNKVLTFERIIAILTTTTSERENNIDMYI